jgi:hypothetical protein
MFEAKIFRPFSIPYPSKSINIDIGSPYRILSRKAADPGLARHFWQPRRVLSGAIAFGRWITREYHG